MSIGTNEHAILAADTYKDRSEHIGKDPIEIQGVHYKILDTKINSLTGYQGTVYQKLDVNGQSTGEVIIAHRGTEFGREPIKDGAIADGNMIFNGLNIQAREAEAFTKHAIELAKQASERDGKPLHITVTGHSLGGTLAELTAYKFQLHGETFNAYGAAGLLHGVPEGGNQVINHVRATDVVSAASKHFGDVRIYATAQDIDRLARAHYRDNGSGLRNMISAIDADAHGIANFVPDAQGHSAFDLENTVRYRAHHGMVDRFRQDVLTTRTVVSARWEVQKAAHALAFEAGQVMAMESAARLLETYDTARDTALNTGHFIGKTYDQAHEAMARSTQAMSQSMSYLAQSFSGLGTQQDQRLHEQEQQARQREATTAHRVDVSAITPHSSIDDMFEALYQASVAQDHATMSAVSQAYLQSPDGQAFLQMGRDYNQQLERQQAMEQQMVHQGPALSR